MLYKSVLVDWSERPYWLDKLSQHDEKTQVSSNCGQPLAKPPANSQDRYSYINKKMNSAKNSNELGSRYLSS